MKLRSTPQTPRRYIPRPAEDEILVFTDFCETCMNAHPIAHYPDGHTRCTSSVKDPQYYFAGHHAGVFTYKLRSSSPFTYWLQQQPQPVDDHELIDQNQDW